MSAGILLLWICVLFFFFFFQAEDGIRDLVRSRGLGDVYKRQVRPHATQEAQRALDRRVRPHGRVFRAADEHDVEAVSYTHLTLPTSDLV